MSDTIKRLETAEMIPVHDFVGYLWYSDSHRPEIINSDNKFDAKKLTELPFVVEGMLYAEKEGVSVRIVNVDGDYLISQMTLPESFEGQKQCFFAKEEFGEHLKICVYEYYENVVDKLDENKFSVLTPTWTAFVGFEN